MPNLTLLFLLFIRPIIAPPGYESAGADRVVRQTTPASVYQYDSFRSGVVTFRNGSRQRARLNYNLALARLAFVGDQGDTLLLTNKIRIRHVLIDERQYLTGQRDDDDDLEVLATYPELRLAQTIKAVVGGNGETASTQQFKADSTSSVPNALLLVSQGREFQWQNNASAHIARQKIQLYVVDNNDRLHQSSYRNLTRLMRQKKADIDRYLAGKAVNFDDPRQVINLIEAVK